jgi:D-lactate dehydrogenase (cytochrome)
MHRIEARPPRTPVVAPAALRAPDEVATYLTDASRYPGGTTPVVYHPRTEGEVAWILRHEARVLPVGAQSSLTGGAAPQGDAVVSLARMDKIHPVQGDRVRVEAGVALVTLQDRLAAADAWYPPVPTYTGALMGGVVSTNAAGAATWKYGSTRPWVRGLTVVLATGDVLDVRRGEVTASPQGRFEVVLPDKRVLDVPIPTYTMPDVAKRSAGYHAAPGMDLIDLFVGSEGTLGVVTEVELAVLKDPPQTLVMLVPFPRETLAIGFTGELREASRVTWKTKDKRGLDVSAVESMDRRSLELVREDGLDTKNGVKLLDDVDTALMVQLEVPAEIDAGEAFAAFGEGGRAPDTCVARLLKLLQTRGVLDDVEVALPGDDRRLKQLLAVREAVPMCVNHRVQAAQRDVDPKIHKVGGDMIVPFARLDEMMRFYRHAFEKRGLDHAIWGHMSDGNLHPNVIPRSHEDVVNGKEVLLELGREVARLGGCPLAEHGTGRNPVKQTLLRQLYGEPGIESMRRTRRALDPDGRLSRGVLFA